MLNTRALALGALLVAVIVVGVLVIGGGGTDYTVKANFINASQIVKGDLVQVGGVPIGKVQDIALTEDGQAQLTLHLTGDHYAPLRRGTKLIVRQASLSGVANRYIDVSLPPGDARTTGTWPEDSTIPAQDTTSAVDLDQLFNVFGPRERRGLSEVLRGSAAQYHGKGNLARAGWAYLNPYIASNTALFSELNRDTPKLRRFVVQSAGLVGDIAQRRNDLAGLVDHLATTMALIQRPRGQLGRAIRDLPPFMHRANSTFVDLRAALSDLDPLVRDSKPVARKLRPFLATLRPFARDARPTVRDLARIISAPGRNNDLIELTNGLPPLADVTVHRVRANGKLRQGAFPASTRALGQATPELGEARPYAVDLTGWFDDFSHSGVYDALGASSRVQATFNAFLVQDGTMLPILPNLRAQAFAKLTSTGQYDKCPGSAARPQDGSSPYKPSPDFPCDPTQIPPGK